MLMRTIKAVFVLSISFWLLAGCGGGTPEKAVEKAPAAENAQ